MCGGFFFGAFILPILSIILLSPIINYIIIIAIATPAYYKAIENSIQNHGDLDHKRASGIIKF